MEVGGWKLEVGGWMLDVGGIASSMVKDFPNPRIYHSLFTIHLSPFGEYSASTSYLSPKFGT